MKRYEERIINPINGGKPAKALVTRIVFFEVSERTEMDCRGKPDVVYVAEKEEDAIMYCKRNNPDKWCGDMDIRRVSFVIPHNPKDADIIDCEYKREIVRY